MKNYLKDKVIIITGAGSGFGKLTAEIASGMGAKVVCVARTEAKLKSVVEGIRAKGGIAEYITTDVSNIEQTRNMANFTLERFGRIDVLINSAGIMPFTMLREQKTEILNKVIDINLKGPINTITAVIDTMRKQGEGHIVNISSRAAFLAQPTLAAYHATKIGIKGISDTLRNEENGIIRVSTIYPGGSGDTGLFDSDPNIRAYCDTRKQDRNDISSVNIEAEVVAENIIYVINQPPGVQIADLNLTGSNDSDFAFSGR